MSRRNSELNGGVEENVDQDLENQEGLEPGTPGWVDEGPEQRSATMATYMKNMQAVVAKLNSTVLGVTATDKHNLLQGMVGLKACVVALEAKKAPTEQETQTIASGNRLLRAFEEALEDQSFQKELQNPKVFKAFMETLQDAVKVARAPQNANPNDIRDLYKAGLAAEQSFHPKLKMLGQALLGFVAVVVLVAVVAAAIYLTGGLAGIPILAGAAAWIGSAATASAGAAATAGTVMHAAAVGSGITAAASSAGAVVAAHPFAALAVGGTAATAGAYYKGKVNQAAETKTDASVAATKEKFQNFMHEYGRATQATQQVEGKSKEVQEITTKYQPK